MGRRVGPKPTNQQANKQTNQHNLAMFRRSTPTNKTKKQMNLRSIDFASLWDILGSVFWEFGAGIGASEISEVK